MEIFIFEKHTHQNIIINRNHNLNYDKYVNILIEEEISTYHA